MQTISRNKITQKQHGQYKAVDIGRFDEDGKLSDLDWYAPEDCLVTIIDTVDDDSCGKRIKFTGASGEHGVCHNERFYVKVGQRVKRGQKMARMGFSGYTEPDNVPSGTHAHWILLHKGQWVYPPSLVNQAFIKLEEDDMVTEHILNIIFRYRFGKPPTATQKQAYVGKKTPDEVDKIITSGKDYKAQIAKIKVDKADLNGYLPGEMR